MLPIFGVCLRHQAICEAFGGTVGYAKQLMHGKVSQVKAAPDSVLFDGKVMAVEDAAARVFGVQFHPESVMTPDGAAIIANFLALV